MKCKASSSLQISSAESSCLTYAGEKQKKKNQLILMNAYYMVNILQVYLLMLPNCFNLNTQPNLDTKCYYRKELLGKLFHCKLGNQRLESWRINRTWASEEGHSRKREYVQRQDNVKRNGAKLAVQGAKSINL